MLLGGQRQIVEPVRCWNGFSLSKLLFEIETRWTYGRFQFSETHPQ
jgi:hypothetical protein